MKKTTIQITIKYLKELNACVDGVKWWKSLKTTDLKTILVASINSENPEIIEYGNWLICRILTPSQNVEYAIFAARQALDVFEAKYPSDMRPRNAIEAAERYLENPTKSAADAADAADAAADAEADAVRAGAYAADAAFTAFIAADTDDDYIDATAEAAAHAADAAAYAAAYAADAAASAARAAHAAADAAASAARVIDAGTYAADAADTAAHAIPFGDVKIKTIQYGMSLLGLDESIAPR